MDPAQNAPIYPACSVVARTLQVGGRTKSELLEASEHQGIQINEAGKVLFASDRFMTSPTPRQLNTVELSVCELGFPQGATLPEIYARAAYLGLQLGPVELGPHFRLQFLDQPEGFLGQPVSQHRAPPGSITVASELLSQAEDFPKGFYLRRIQGTLWLRGYRCSSDHLWNPEDRFLFSRP